MIANRTRYILALTAAGLLAATAPALAEIVSYKADLNGASEVPPTSSKALGSVTATYDTASKKLSWKNVGRSSKSVVPAVRASRTLLLQTRLPSPLIISPLTSSEAFKAPNKIGASFYLQTIHRADYA